MRKTDLARWAKGKATEYDQKAKDAQLAAEIAAGLNLPNGESLARAEAERGWRDYWRGKAAAMRDVQAYATRGG